MSFSVSKRLQVSFLTAMLVLSLAGEGLVVLAGDCDDLTGDAQDTCQELTAKSKAFKQIVNLKERQGEQLSSQLQTLEGEVRVLADQIDQNQRNINVLADGIAVLASRIVEKEETIAKQKKMLGALMRSQYSNDTDAAFKIIVAPAREDELSFFQTDVYTSDASTKIKELLGDIRSLREGLLRDKVELEAKQSSAMTLRQELTAKNLALEDLKEDKSTLLAKTRVDKEKYEDLLANIEVQKKELLDFSAASNIDELSDSVKDYPAPDKKYWASTDWYFSQKDSRWGSKRIGNSRSLMKDYGCAVTSVSMVFRKYGAGTDPGKMLNQKIFSYDLIQWPSTWSPSIERTSSVSHGNISWSEIDSEIKKDHPVIVYIKKTNGQGGHYVVITGKDSKDYIVHDPFFGPNLYLKTSRSLVGKIGNDSGTVIDQMIIYEK